MKHFAQNHVFGFWRPNSAEGPERAATTNGISDNICELAAAAFFVILHSKSSQLTYTEGFSRAAEFVPEEGPADSKNVGCGAWDVGCGSWNTGCGAWDVGCGAWDVGCGAWGVGCRAGCTVLQTHYAEINVMFRAP